MTYRAVIFDWDGTLVDSLDHIAGSLRRAALEIGFPARTEAAYRNIIGLGIVEALDELYPGITRQDMKALREAYSRHFFSETTAPSSLFEGIPELLVGLRRAGRQLAVATGKSRRGLDRALNSSGLGPHFEITRCADETLSKPDPLMLKEILAYFRLEPSEAVMIGDTVYDLDMAQRIGMPSIGVTWGVHEANDFASFEPRAIVDTVDALQGLLMEG
ncbi:HAD family hydrolase [Mangrovitalea sediminis]|uniref:HAD family hydrolase n=1 Tax=Mangrovitalea sediminis TaxID=1982043 RepID=UPI000BE5E9D5|nr:HAD-IA family hydrolase [Mangrovitalea sediminis]